MKTLFIACFLSVSSEAAEPPAPAVWGPGEYLPSNRLPATEAFRSRLHEGYRAMSLTLDSDQAMFVKSGDRVDIMATLAFPGRGKSTATLMQYVLVLDARRSESSPGKHVLLVALNPNEAQYIALATDSGKIRVILRGEGDMELHSMELACLRKLFR